VQSSIFIVVTQKIAYEWWMEINVSNYLNLPKHGEACKIKGI
jgi:hypothetical protein